jgi:hypothetical protein
LPFEWRGNQWASSSHHCSRTDRYLNFPSALIALRQAAGPEFSSPFVFFTDRRGQR